MLAHRLWRRPIIRPTFQRLLFAGNVFISNVTRQTRGDYPMVVTVGPASQKLAQHRVNALCFLSYLNNFHPFQVANRVSGTQIQVICFYFMNVWRKVSHINQTLCFSHLMGESVWSLPDYYREVAGTGLQSAYVVNKFWFGSLKNFRNWKHIFIYHVASCDINPPVAKLFNWYLTTRSCVSLKRSTTSSVDWCHVLSLTCLKTGI